MRENFKPAWKTAAIAALTLGTTMSLASCSGGSSVAPEEVFKAYVEALNQGEYVQALAMVADPGEVTPDNIYNFTDFTYQEPLLRGEPLDPKAEAGTFSMDLDGVATPVEVEKRDGQWKLRNTVFLTPFDYSDAMATFDHFNEVGEVSFATENGKGLDHATGFSLLPDENNSGQQITVSIAGTFVPDQEMTVSAGSLGDGWTEEFDLGELPTTISPIANELAYVDYQYDVAAHEYITQSGPITLTDCWFEPSGGVDLSCEYRVAAKDFDNNEFLRPGATGVPDESKYDNLAEFSMRYFSGCHYTLGEKTETTEPDGVIKVRIEDGNAVALWGHVGEETTGYAPEATSWALTEDDVIKECSGWAPSKAGTVIQGVVPLESDQEGSVVSAKL